MATENLSPVVSSILRRLRGQAREPASPENFSPVVSFVLGSYNRVHFLKKTIASIRTNGIDVPYEIIVIEGGSTDGALEWLITQKDIITIVQHNRGTFLGKPLPRRSWGYFMNLGFKTAQGKYVLMLSDDCLLLPNAVNAGLARFESVLAEGRRIGALAFYFRDWPNQKEYGAQLTLGGKLFVNHGMFLRQALQEVEWADEERYIFYKADGDLCLRMWSAGYEVLDSPESLVEHYAHANLQVRQTNEGSVLAHDRAAYLKRWQGIYYFPDQPEARKRLTLQFEDASHTAEQFLQELPEDLPLETGEKK